MNPKIYATATASTDIIIRNGIFVMFTKEVCFATAQLGKAVVHFPKAWSQTEIDAFDDPLITEDILFNEDWEMEDTDVKAVVSDNDKDVAESDNDASDDDDDDNDADNLDNFKRHFV